MYLDKKLSKQEQPNVLVFHFMQSLIKLKVLGECSQIEYFSDTGRRHRMYVSSTSIGRWVRFKWKRQGWYKFQNKTKIGEGKDA